MAHCSKDSWAAAAAVAAQAAGAGRGAPGEVLARSFGGACPEQCFTSQSLRLYIGLDSNQRGRRMLPSQAAGTEVSAGLNIYLDFIL